MENLKNLVNVKNAKTFAVAVLSFLTLAANAEKRVNLFVKSEGKAILVKDAETNEERLIQNVNSKKLVEDLPYFQAGDTITINPTKKYEDHRVFNYKWSNFKYNKKLIVIRKETKVVDDWKAGRKTKTR